MAKKIFSCWCGDEFKTAKGLSLHRTQKKHQAIPKKETFHAYSDLAKSDWGRDCLDKDWKSPSHDELQIAALFAILRTLERVERQLERKRIIS